MYIHFSGSIIHNFFIYIFVFFTVLRAREEAKDTGPVVFTKSPAYRGDSVIKMRFVLTLFIVKKSYIVDNI